MTATEREQIARVLGDTWDDGNAVGLDGWTGPGRGTEPVDEYAERARERTIDKAADALAPLLAEAEARGARRALVAEAAWWENIADDPGADSTFTEAQYAGIVAKDIRTRLTQTGGTHD